jgi:hypothetical protein
MTLVPQNSNYYNMNQLNPLLYICQKRKPLLYAFSKGITTDETPSFYIFHNTEMLK